MKQCSECGKEIPDESPIYLCFDCNNKPMKQICRKYHRGERGLESRERQMLESKRMQTLIEKASKKYGVQFKRPGFRPVFFSKKIRKNWGIFYGNCIKLSHSIYDSKYAKEDTLWHEIVHAFVSDNYPILQQSRLQETWSTLYGPFEREIFRMAINDGSHESWNYKLICDCGWWFKSLKRQKQRHCPRCTKELVSPIEFRKLQRIAAINSQTAKVEINRYKPWKKNERIQE